MSALWLLAFITINKGLSPNLKPIGYKQEKADEQYARQPTPDVLSDNQRVKQELT
jgi:hypothetical protein|tara:strand:- start:3673 stop:3837 length:165 start_codon:yes stop_codon:yes gene_type:complete